MSNSFLILASVFVGWQIALIVIVSVLLAGLITLNVYFSVIWRVKAERRLHNEELQSRRSALLAKIEYLKGGGEALSYQWVDPVDETYDEGSEDEDDESFMPSAAPVAADQPLNTVVLEVDSLSSRMRNKIGMRAKRFNGKRFYVRYSLGFEAKLRYSEDDAKTYYTQISDEIRSYEKIKLEKGFARQRILFGNELLGTILFLGKRLCVALALDPAKYANGKYHGEDKSDKKRFAKTPMLIRVLSENKVEVFKYLFERLADKFGIEKGKTKVRKYDLKEKSKEDMVCCGAMRVVIVDEVPVGAMVRTQQVDTKARRSVNNDQSVLETAEEAAATVNSDEQSD